MTWTLKYVSNTYSAILVLSKLENSDLSNKQINQSLNKSIKIGDFVLLIGCISESSGTAEMCTNQAYVYADHYLQTLLVSLLLWVFTVLDYGQLCCHGQWWPTVLSYAQLAGGTDCWASNADFKWNGNWYKAPVLAPFTHLDCILSFFPSFSPPLMKKRRPGSLSYSGQLFFKAFARTLIRIYPQLESQQGI